MFLSNQNQQQISETAGNLELIEDRIEDGFAFLGFENRVVQQVPEFALLSKKITEAFELIPGFAQPPLFLNPGAK